VTAIFGYFLCLLMIVPVFSPHVFGRLIGQSTRPHDLLGLFRFAVQTMVNVTSPVKIALMLAVVTSVFLARGVRLSRRPVLTTAPF
jgi:hypothetical protein